MSDNFDFLSRGVKTFVFLVTWFVFLGVAGGLIMYATFPSDTTERTYTRTTLTVSCVRGIMVEEDLAKGTRKVVMEQTGEHQFTAVRCN